MARKAGKESTRTTAVREVRTLAGSKSRVKLTRGVKMIRKDARPIEIQASMRVARPSVRAGSGYVMVIRGSDGMRWVPRINA